MTSPLRSDAQAARDVVIFKALANAVRLQIVSIVASAPEGQVSAGHIVDQFGLSQPTISHHLKVLRDAGVLTAHKTSTFVFYRFTPQVRQAVSGLIPAEPVAQPPARMPRPVRRPPTPRRTAVDEWGSAPPAVPVHVVEASADHTPAPSASTTTATESGYPGKAPQPGRASTQEQTQEAAKSAKSENDKRSKSEPAKPEKDNRSKSVPAKSEKDKGSKSEPAKSEKDKRTKSDKAGKNGKKKRGKKKKK